MATRWNPVHDSVGGWYWYSKTLPNGWAACVTDHSQSYAPRRATGYEISAVSRAQIISAPDSFDSFEAAKWAAIRFASEQQPALSTPSLLR